MSRAVVLQLALRLSAFYAAMFLVTGIQLPFWPVWLASRGLTSGEIGVLLAAAIWVKVLATPAIGTLADKTGGRSVLMGALVALGYRPAEAERLLKAVAPGTHSTEELIRRALQGAARE